MHECVLTDRRQLAHGVTTADIAKRLMDYGYHPPTIYFPLVVAGALMIEPTECESQETLDGFIEAMRAIAREAETEPAASPARRRARWCAASTRCAPRASRGSAGRGRLMRRTERSTALAVVLLVRRAPAARAQNPFAGELTVEQEKEMTAQIAAQIRQQAKFVTDPVVLDYVDAIGERAW